MSSPCCSKGRLPSTSPPSFVTQCTEPASAGSCARSSRPSTSRPICRQISKVRALMTCAAGERNGPSRCSTMTTEKPILSKSSAAVSPTGPAPTIRTSVSRTSITRLQDRSHRLGEDFDQRYNLPERYKGRHKHHLLPRAFLGVLRQWWQRFAHMPRPR